jgi:hypothetical protein
MTQRKYWNDFCHSAEMVNLFFDHFCQKRIWYFNGINQDYFSKKVQWRISTFIIQSKRNYRLMINSKLTEQICDCHLLMQ